MANNFETAIAATAVSYIEDHQGAIIETAQELGVDPIGLAGSIAREMTAADSIYTIAFLNSIWRLAVW